ncbi:MAG: YqcC family protein [Aliiglaciecola sp.]|uniref:YqcC family protein n=1 Tax=Aliiglaciecola sp. TaxID=1872441 RepID=UPI003298D127
MTISRTEILNRLSNLEVVMRREKLWAAQAPSQDALKSELPFAFDTLSIEQWLQFVFIPKMTELINRGLALPNSMVILPAVQNSLREEDYPLVYKAINEIDLLFNAGNPKS